MCIRDRVKEYAEFLQDVAALKNEKILLERKKASFAVCESIDASCRIIDEMNPCATMKAVKDVYKRQGDCCRCQDHRQPGGGRPSDYHRRTDGDRKGT